MTNEDDRDEVFVQLVVDHQAALRAFVAALLPGHPEIKDVVQEVNSAVWRKRNEFTMGSNFKAWVFSVAKFKVLAVWRDQKRQKVWSVPGETLERLIDEAMGGGLDASDVRQDALRECLQQLRPADRGLVFRRYYDGLSLRELGGEVGRKAENLKGSLHRIRLSLRACVERKLSQRRT